MENLNLAMERIRIMECPTGQVEKKVLTILRDYHISDDNEIQVTRNEELDQAGAQAYKAKISGNINQEIILLARSGLDDYVAAVVDVFINQ